MPRFRNEFGSVVNVDEALAERIGEDWKPLDKPESRTKTDSDKSKS